MSIYAAAHNDCKHFLECIPVAPFDIPATGSSQTEHEPAFVNVENIGSPDRSKGSGFPISGHLSLVILLLASPSPVPSYNNNAF